MESTNHRLALHIYPPSVPLPSSFATPLLSSYSSIYFHFPYPFHPLSTPLISTFKSKKPLIYWLSYASYKIKINLQFLNITNNTNSVCQSKSSFSNLMKIFFYRWIKVESINHHLKFHIYSPSVPLPSSFTTPILSSYSSIYFHFTYPLYTFCTPYISTFKSENRIYTSFLMAL